MERLEKKIRERRQVDTEVGLHGTNPACISVAANEASVTNHTCQKHILPIKFVSILQVIISSTGFS